jgi:hypothetical protein
MTWPPVVRLWVAWSRKAFLKIGAKISVSCPRW